MDREDPEDRIAELERLFLERGHRHVAESTPLGGSSPGQRSFEATAPRVSWKLMAFVVYGVLFACLFVPSVLEATRTHLDKSFGELMHWGIIGLYGVVGVGLAQSQTVRSFFSPKATIRVDGDDVDITRSGKTRSFPTASATVGPWTTSQMAMGSALHLRNGLHRYAIGGQNYIPTRVQLTAGPVWSVNAYMTAQEFGSLLTMVLRSHPAS